MDMIVFNKELLTELKLAKTLDELPEFWMLFLN